MWPTRRLPVLTRYLLTRRIGNGCNAQTLHTTTKSWTLSSLSPPPPPPSPPSLTPPRPSLSMSPLPQHDASSNLTTTLEHRFFSHNNRGTNNRDGPDGVELGRTIRTLTARLPSLLAEGSLPSAILSEHITLELLPSTLGLPEIKGCTAYVTLSRLATWSVATLAPRATLVIDSQRLIGSAQRCDRLTVRFRIVSPVQQDKREERAVDHADSVSAAGPWEETTTTTTIYTGIFHFYFDARGKVSRHVLEVVDDRFTPSHFVDWLMGRQQKRVALGYCYQALDKK